MLFFFLGMAILYLDAVYAGEGTVNAYGCVYCNGTPLKNITVKMYDVDNIIDAFMGRNVTDGRGCFFVNGTAMDLRDDIDPVINFYHTCEMGIDFGRCLLKSRLFLDAAETVNTAEPLNLTKIDVTSLPTGKDCIH